MSRLSNADLIRVLELALEDERAHNARLKNRVAELEAAIEAMALECAKVNLYGESKGEDT
jgi:hypothetical protein